MRQHTSGMPALRTAWSCELDWLVCLHCVLRGAVSWTGWYACTAYCAELWVGLAGMLALRTAWSCELDWLVCLHCVLRGVVSWTGWYVCIAYCVELWVGLKIIPVCPSVQLFTEAVCVIQRALFTVMKNVSERNIKYRAMWGRWFLCVWYETDILIFQCCQLRAAWLTAKLHYILYIE